MVRFEPVAVVLRGPGEEEVPGGHEQPPGHPGGADARQEEQQGQNVKIILFY